MNETELKRIERGEIEGGDRYSTQQVPGEGGQKKREFSLLASQTFFRLTQSFVIHQQLKKSVVVKNVFLFLSAVTRKPKASLPTCSTHLLFIDVLHEHPGTSIEPRARATHNSCAFG